MQNGSTIRRHLARGLAVCFLAQVAWVGLSLSTVANLSRHHLAPTQRVALGAGARSLQPAPAANYFGSGLPGIPEVSFDFCPQWNVSLLAKIQTSHPGLLPADTARFGRAPPSSVL
jgi:hypothetical protein